MTNNRNENLKDCFVNANSSFSYIMKVYNQYCSSKFKHFIYEWILKHLSWQIRSPQRGQLERDRFPQIEQYLCEGYLGLPTFILQKFGSVFSYSPSYCMILRKLRLRFRCPYFLALLFMRFSFFRFLGSPSPTSNTSSSSSSAILLGSSKKSSSKYLSFY